MKNDDEAKFSLSAFIKHLGTQFYYITTTIKELLLLSLFDYCLTRVYIINILIMTKLDFSVHTQKPWLGNGGSCVEFGHILYHKIKLITRWTMQQVTGMVWNSIFYSLSLMSILNNMIIVCWTSIFFHYVLLNKISRASWVKLVFYQCHSILFILQVLPEMKEFKLILSSSHSSSKI